MKMLNWNTFGVLLQITAKSKPYPLTIQYTRAKHNIWFFIASNSLDLAVYIYFSSLREDSFYLISQWDRPGTDEWMPRRLWQTFPPIILWLNSLRKANTSRRWAKGQTPITIYIIDHKIALLPLLGSNTWSPDPKLPEGRARVPSAFSPHTKHRALDTTYRGRTGQLKEPKLWSQTDWGRLRLCIYQL